MPQVSKTNLIRSLCKKSYVDFVQEFWECIPGAGTLIWNWHMEEICNELQEVAERVFRGEKKKYDLLFNISPGTSKSSLCSILFQPWTWTRMPIARHITGSNTDTLALDLANKSRFVIRHEKYQECFPEIQLRTDQDTKGYFTNTLGGDRFTCTVGGKSPIGFHGHFITCLSWESCIMTDRGLLPIGEVVDKKLPVKVLGYDHTWGCPRWQTIRSWDKNPGQPLYRISFSDGSHLRATGDHPLFVTKRGYIPITEVCKGDEVLYVKKMPSMQQRDHCHQRDLVEKKQQILQCKMPGGFLPRSSTSILQVLQQKIRTRGRIVDQLLQSQMQAQENEWGKSPQIQQSRNKVRGLRQNKINKSRLSPLPAILQQQMQELGYSWQEQSLMERKDKIQVRLLRKRDLLETLSVPFWKCKVLFSGLCQQSSCEKNEWPKQSKLHRWYGLCPIPTRIQNSQQEGKETGEVSLLSLWKKQDRLWPEIAYSPHQLEQARQFSREPCGSLHILPHEASGCVVEEIETGTKVITSIEREVRLPEAVYNLETAEDHNYFAEGTLVHNCDDPLDPKKAVSEQELKAARDFMTNVLPSRKVNKDVSVTILIMQRLHEADPSGVMLEKGNLEGAGNVRHICLPATEADNISPPELRAKYVDGLMDPVRLSKKSLEEFRLTLGTYGYSGQFEQNPVPLGGGMFKEEFFSNRVKAAPYESIRIRYWDRAASQDHGCFTAGTLIAMNKDGNFFVEDVVKGQWEPDTRDDRIVSTALRDRARYGPKHEPKIYIEHEPGSSGVDAYKYTARKLVGFVVFPDRPSGSKEVRAESWASQCAAKNVYLVEDGSWDIHSWIEEHKLFPLGKYKDQVDSASGAFLKLVAMKKQAGEGLRIIPLKKRDRKNFLRIVVCNRTELPNLHIDQRTLLVSILDPEPVGIAEVPLHGLDKISDFSLFQFADLDPREVQDNWAQEVEGYGRTPDKLVMTPEIGKRIWAFILRRRDPPIEVLVIQDNDDRRATSLAYAIADAMSVEKDTIYFFGTSDNKSRINNDNGKILEAPNKHVYEVAKQSRWMVVH